jgi:hypothetical protein
VRFGFAIHSLFEGERQAMLWLKMVSSAAMTDGRVSA